MLEKGMPKMILRSKGSKDADLAIQELQICRFGHPGGGGDRSMGDGSWKMCPTSFAMVIWEMSEVNNKLDY